MIRAFPSTAGAAATAENQVVDDKTKRMKLMRFWLIGTFIFVIAAITAYIIVWTRLSVLQALWVGLPIWAITLVACLSIFFGYQ